MREPLCTEVLALPNFDPGDGRIELRMPAGRTLAEIAQAALPEVTGEDRLRLRIVLISATGSEAIEPRFWGCVRPRPGVRVVIRAVPGKNVLKSVLTVVVSIAAVALGQVYGLSLGTFLGFSGATAQMVGAALIGIAVTAIGTLAINALIPVDDLEAENRYSISGWRNQARPDGAVPVVMGARRWAPPFAAASWTEIVGDFQYVRAVFCLGYGELEISDLWIGETAIEDYDEVTVEIRTGAEGDEPISLYPQQVVEQSVGVEILRPLNRDDLGEITSGSTLDPVTRTTSDDASGAALIFCWPGGLVRVNDDGDKKPVSVSIQIEYRRDDGASDWVEETTLTVSAAKLEMFWRQYTLTFPERGRYDIRVTMLTEETTSTQIQCRTSWVALQTLRPEYPINMAGLALIGVRIKATYQLQGTLDTLTAMVARVCLDWDAPSGTWIRRATRNPASLFRYILQSPANAKACANALIDLEALQDWHDFCALHGLEFNDVFEDSALSVGAALARVAAAGRAAVRWTGTKWTVVIDRPRDLIVDHIGPRNSWGFKVSRKYFTPPDGQRVKFLDATNDYKAAERYIPWPGNEGGAMDLVEEVSRPGKTSPDEIWTETRRRMYETIHRPDIYQVTQDGAVRVATRGDLVALSHYILDGQMTVARVRAATGELIELDETLVVQEGVNYGIRFRVFDAEDTIGTSEHRAVDVIQAARPALLRLSGSGARPVAGDLVQFGVLGEESIAAIVTGVEAGQNMTAILTLADAAPQIDALIAAETVPEWSGRTGVILEPATTAPPIPVITSITSDIDPTHPYFTSLATTYTVTVALKPGAGSATITSRFEIYWRVAGAAGWTVIAVPASSGGASFEAERDTVLEVEARAFSATGTASAKTATITLTVGAADPALPEALALDAIEVSELWGGLSVAFAVSDPDTQAVQIYRSMTGTLDRANDAAGKPVAVEAGQSYTRVLGTSRANKVQGGSLNDPAPWAAAPSWSIADGRATHTPGATGALSQALPLIEGRAYRLGITVTGRTAGSLTPVLAGGAEVVGAPISTDGRALDRLLCAAGNDRIELRPSADFDGAVDQVVVYLEAAACLAQGTHFIWLEAQNAKGLGGAVTGPFTLEVV